MDIKWNSLNHGKVIGFLISCLASQLLCYYILDDIIVSLIHLAPIVYIANRVIIAIILYVISTAVFSGGMNRTRVNVLFAFYTIFIFGLLFIRRNPYTATEFRINLNPLEIINDLKSSKYALSLLIGNIILFMPFGVYFSYRNMDLKKIHYVMLLSIPSILEIMQLIFKVGVFDINDILLNSFGIFLGLAAYRVYKRSRKTDQEDQV